MGTPNIADMAEYALQQGIERGATLKEVMRLYAVYVYEKHERNKVHAAKVLKVNRRSLQRWNLDT